MGHTIVSKFYELAKKLVKFWEGLGEQPGNTRMTKSIAAQLKRDFGSMNKQFLDAATAERKGRQPEPSITAEDGGRDYDLSYLEQWWAQILEHRFFHRLPALVS